MYGGLYHWRLIGLAVAVGLFAACTPTPAPMATAVTPTVTLQPTKTPTAVITAAPTPLSTDRTSVTPLTTAPAIRFASWSPDSRWVAYWASSQEDVGDYAAYGFPAGTLHFADVETGESCAVPEFVAQDRGVAVHWSDDGAAIVLTPDGVFTGQPCQTESYPALADGAMEESQPLDPALSPGGRYRASTTLQDSRNGRLTFETTLAASDDVQPLQRVTWRIDERLGEYGLGGEWISRNQFLIHETLTEGPLLVDVDQGVVSVLTELFGLQETPSILDEEGYGWRAMAAPGVEPGTFHLLLSGVGLEGSFPSVMLYHAESGLVETLPYRHVWWEPFSADRGWLLMDERPLVDGYESHVIWIRRVEDVDGAWQLLAADVDAALWNAGWTEMAFSSDEIVTWQTFPDAEVLGRWDTGQFRTYPVAWSPDRRFLVAEGNVPGLWQYGLFVLERPATSLLPLPIRSRSGLAATASISTR